MAYADDVKLAAEAAAKAALASKAERAGGAKTPDPAATIVREGREADRENTVSKPYSFCKMAEAMLHSVRSPLTAGTQTGKIKYESAVHERLKGLYHENNSPVGTTPGAMLVPMNTRALVDQAETSKDERFAVELHDRVKGYDHRQVDQDVVNRREKSFNLSNEEEGGILRGPAQLGDLIDLMRNVMVFDRAGATEITIPSNGMLKLPKKTGSTTSYWEGEGFTLSPETSQKFGVLDLVLKKQFSLARMTNEVGRFTSIDGEAMLRKDMTASAARLQDKTMLQGLNPAAISAGAKAPRGLITYKRATPLTQWTEFEDYLIEYTASGAATNGDRFEPQDVNLMLSKLPDEVQESDNLKFVGRFDFFAAISSRRSDAVTAADGKGLFVTGLTRDAGDKQKKMLAGYDYVGSSQVSNTRVKGSGTNLTYLLAGDFSNWVIGRLPVAEFLPNALADSTYTTDTTLVRLIQYVDGGARHASAFVLCDQLLVA